MRAYSNLNAMVEYSLDLTVLFDDMLHMVRYVWVWGKGVWGCEVVVWGVVRTSMVCVVHILCCFCTFIPCFSYAALAHTHYTCYTHKHWGQCMPAMCTSNACAEWN